ncbi:PIN2/TERF1-interacting telomerase inhibitor 1 isoform X2 [Hippocampus zosterae]|uniref:PIN2/TERF1-interacting telomerase inhibitor 1 isoform X2 n=1 Tax=Hippocampus zosterae TaxID=109293 RepID=UPI00223DF869|nr:PIN2/TERF1-interacting telomerase inhibitor 1 isoform X2 [Hippocampus zosterae]
MMSMLAEPRRKQKWSVDPRNSAWSNDESKFGQKMLERMGWSKGKGLGKSEQGAVDHIKVKVKNNSYGLGANGSQEDNWIAHQDDFNDLLAQLNNCHGQNCTETQPEEQKGFSLEEKSKTSKKRVHYMKFTQGKDLSSRSSTDLNCIFGRRAKSATHPEQESGGDCHGDGAECPTPPAAVVVSSPQADAESITKTVTSTLSVQEYFARRMARLKSGRARADAADGAEEPPKRKKKKKKKAVEKMEAANAAEEASEPEPAKKKKKRQNEGAVDDHHLAEPKEAKKEKKGKKETLETQSKWLQQPEETTAVRKKCKKREKPPQRHL